MRDLIICIILGLSVFIFFAACFNKFNVQSVSKDCATIEQSEYIADFTNLVR